MSDHEEDEDGGGEEQLDTPKNTNRDEVTREEQERRERMKAEAATKREKDKLDRSGIDSSVRGRLMSKSNLRHPSCCCVYGSGTRDHYLQV